MNIQLTLELDQAKVLWGIIGSCLSQDAADRNSGEGGLFYPAHAACLMEILSKLAVNIDAANQVSEVSPAPSLIV
jgi:hypothetical protein